MKFTVTGISHRSSPLEIREKIALSKKKMNGMPACCWTRPGIRSFFILSTCNRFEIYLWSESTIDSSQIFCDMQGMTETEIAPFLYVYEGQDAWRHFIRVGCGLDSQILGEPQILGQIRQVVSHAKGVGHLDPVALWGVQRAISIAEGIRNDAQIRYPLRTVADAAFDLIRRYDPVFREKSFLLIGTGKVMELFLPFFVREGIAPVIASNRNHAKAVEWAHLTGGRAFWRKDLVRLVPEADIVISATSCSHAVLSREYFLHVKKPIFVLDLAVPRDADPAIRSFPGVRLFDIDDIGLSATEGCHLEWIHNAGQSVQKESVKLWNELSESEHEEALLL